MCIDCLNIRLEAISKYEKDISVCMDTNDCECCVSYYKFLIGVNNDFKVLCKTKIKKNEQIEKDEPICKLIYFEGMVKQRIKNKLQNVLETIDEKKEDMKEHSYLIKMNELKALNDFLEDIEIADHNI